jgi:SAM-dependent methyltransferase
VGQSTFLDFARGHLPPPSARVLEVGCGQGELTVALQVAGYEPLGIDPRAPDGEVFRRVLLEDLDPEEPPFDAVVAAYSLHHMRDLDQALDRIVALLRPGGVLALDEFSWDLLDEPTADWLWGQRRALAAAGQGEEPPASVEELRSEWETEYLGLHGFEALRTAVDERFEGRAFERSPFLYRKLHSQAAEVLEQALIDAGAIRPLGFRYAGVARSR